MQTTIERLEAEYASNEAAELRAIRNKRNIAEQINAIRLSQRPTFPTPQQVEAIKAAIGIIASGEKHGDHLGDPSIEGYYGVVTDGAPRGWISVRHEAPYGYRGHGSHLWDFTEDEIQAIKDVVIGEGWEVVECWPHADGVSLIVREAR